MINRLKDMWLRRKWNHWEGKYSRALTKANGDDFDYACGLRSGTVIRFTAATFDGEFVHLSGIVDTSCGMRFTFDRGIDVRLRDIEWVADAPKGS
jgi:hypothetical protein